MKRYIPSEIEPKWQQTWADTGIYRAIDFDPRPKYYMLTEFPYPSGAGLHAGSSREYTLGDVIARHKRMQGHNVLYPMGYDAFGLPTENFAIKNKIAPQLATTQNVATFRQQFESLGFSFDWDREVNTTDPDYFRWTQWLFLQFFKKDLAYQDEIAINWCPKCKTGLANEEVVAGLHERCGTTVEKKLLKQWLLRITAYADRLIEGLKSVDYPSRIADQQINWIGRSEGAEVKFPVVDSMAVIEVFTTRIDTIYSGTFLVLAPEHPLVTSLTTPEQKNAVENYVRQVQAESDLDRQDQARPKTGAFTGSYAINPVNNDKIPIWIADFVLAGYGTGAVFADAHDERDVEFAQKFGLPLKTSILPANPEEQEDVKSLRSCFSGDGILYNSDQFDGLSSVEARQKIVRYLEDKGQAKLTVKYKLRDWVFSRQHYWGEPIPIIHCRVCGAVPVPDDQLPVTLPEVKSYEPTDTGESPLATMTDWVNVDCPQCNGAAKRETDTMPNWAGSSWYYLRYMDARNDQAFADRAKLNYWGAVDLYLGGMEHTTLHLLYSRFWHQFFYDQGLVPTPEPYAARRGQGIVLASDGRKMSKSFGNVVNPTDMIARYGADSLRLYLLFMAPYDETTPWSDERLGGVNRFLYRVWNLAGGLLAAKDGEVTGTDAAFATAIDRATHKTLRKVHHDFEDMRFNTVVSALMEYLNVLTKADTLARIKAHPDLADRTLRALILMLAPAAPHITEELWSQLGETGSVHVAAWPQYDPELIKDDLVTVVIQVNGKLRGELVAGVDTSEAELVSLAKSDANVAKLLSEGEVVKTIVVPRKLVNFVVK